jgi:hypothetical protein
MKCPCHGCGERKVGCHSNCPKEPSYDDWKQWSDGRAEIDKSVTKARGEYLYSLINSSQVKRRKR